MTASVDPHRAAGALAASENEPSARERLLGQMLDAMPVAASWVDAQGVVEFWNQRAQQLFGYSLDQVRDRKTFAELAYPDEQYRIEVVARWQLALREAAASGRAVPFGVVKIRSRAGVDVEVDVKGTYVGDKTLVVYHDVTDRLRTERALLDSEARLSAAFASIPDAFAISEVSTGHYILLNTGFTRITGWSEAEALGKSSADLDLWVDYEDRNAVVQRLVETGSVEDYEAKFRRRDGRLIDGVIFGRVVRARNTALIVTLTRDVTVQRELERRVKEAERLDSVGRLAGGVAHDFNNLLTVIQGNLQLALARLPEDHAARAELEETVTASHQAASVTRQLLAFGRKQLLRTRAVDLNAALEGMRDLLRRVLGEDIQLSLSLAPQLGLVVLDEAQLEQVVLNLVLNARDAMPDGGQLRVRTHERTPEPGTDAPQLVRLTVEDTGSGMTPEVRDRIFEPFFTTKEQHKGTGLGLASVYGIVQQSGGKIQVETQLGRGTTFHLDFARSGSPASEPRIKIVAPSPVVVPKHTVLVAEDELSLGKLVRRVLEDAGYVVLLATDAEAAEALAEKHAQTIDLLLTDVVMPNGSGRVLAERLTARRPKLRVLFMSGFTGDWLEQRDANGVRHAFLQKPFTPEVLRARVLEALGG